MATKQKIKPVKKEMSTQRYDPDIAYTSGIPQPEPFNSFLKAYSVHIWVYVAVRAIAQNIAGVEILPYVPKKTKEGTEWQVAENHAFAKLMNTPNPYMSGYQMREYIAAALALSGNAYIFVEKFQSNKPQEFWPLLPDAVQPVATVERMIDHYLFEVGGQKFKLPYENVVHFRNMNPESFVYGLGSMAAAKNTVATDIFAQVWNKSFFGNSARPDSVLETDQVLEDGIRKRIIESWKSMHQGAAKHGKTAILEGGLKHSKVSENAKDMDFVNLRKDLRIEVLAAFGVPPSVAGLLEFANYSNMEQQMKMFWNHTLLPILKNISETFTIRARQMLIDTSGTIFQADTSKVQALQPDMKLMADTARTLIDSGFPPNSVIDALDMPFEHIDGGDVPRLPAVPQLPNFMPEDMPVPSNNAARHAEHKDVKAVEQKKDQTELKKFVAWKGFDDRAKSWESKMRIAVATFFRGQKKRIVRGLNERQSELIKSLQRKNLEDTVSIIFDFERERRIMEGATTKVVRGVYFDFALRMAEQVAPSFDFSLDDPNALAWIKDKTFKLVTEANEYTLETIKDGVRDSIQEAIAQGFSDADTVSEIKDRIDAIYDFAVEGRSERIARTEVISAANAGNHEAMKQTGVTKKEWLSTRDKLTRETHEELDGQQKGLTEPFVSSSGAALQFPGDPAAPPDETINCRCTQIPVSDEQD